MTTKAEGQLVRLDEARTRLAKVASIDEAKQIRDQAEAIRHYAKEQRLGLELQNSAAEIKIRAERRAGEILSEIERQPAKANLKQGPKAQPGPSGKTYTETIKDAGIAPVTAQRWQAEASVPEPIFEAFVATAKESNAELTSAAVVRFAASSAQQPERERRKDIAAAPGVRWAKQMRALSFATRTFVEIAKTIKPSEADLLRKAIDRCIDELRAARKEIA